LIDISFAIALVRKVERVGGDAGVNGKTFAVECDIMCHADVGGTASAFAGMGYNRFIRAQAAQATPNFRLGGLYMTIMHDSAVLVSQQPVYIFPSCCSDLNLYVVALIINHSDIVASDELQP
jgi:hypothetical protein